MQNHINFLFGILEITLLDLALCGDNIGIIALATRNLEKKSAKLAGFIGIAGAIFLRIYFAICLSVFLKIKWLPIKLVGGLLLIKVTWDLIKPQKENLHQIIYQKEKFWDAVLTVIIADISMSLDNVLAIAGTANGNNLLIIIGILINVPIIFFGSQIALNIMQKYEMFIYIGASILASTSVKMVIEDPLFMHFIQLPHLTSDILPVVAAILTMLYGLYIITFYVDQNESPTIS